MAKPRSDKKAVQLTAPNGSKVTVSEESVDRFKNKGYKASTSK